MPEQFDDPRCDALRIWQAGVEAVRADRLMRAAMRVQGPLLHVGPERLPLDSIGRIAVVGAGKAAGKMAAAVEEILGPQLIAEKGLFGWVNVPADCSVPLKRIYLHPARPPGINEPTAEAAAGAAEILRIVQSLRPDDLCICLIAGGGSALLPVPAEGVTLEEKLAVTRFLSAAGANIQQLNTVRKQLSRIKGGGLARACRAGMLIALIISDVPGDPLDVIASGPTVADSSTPAAALEVLRQFGASEAGVPSRILDYLAAKAQGQRGGQEHHWPACDGTAQPGIGCHRRVINLVIGNNATAVNAAAEVARTLGYAVESSSSTSCEGLAEQVGVALAEKALQMRAALQSVPAGECAARPAGPAEHPADDRSFREVAGACYVSGGEPVVKLVDASRRGVGGRNQQLVLAAAEHLWHRDCEGIALLSGGTDGEDGPTDAAGAVLDAQVLAAAHRQQLSPAEYLARNDAYRFFDQLGALIKTGPTHTNVCDLRVVVVRPSRSGG